MVVAARLSGKAHGSGLLAIVSTRACGDMGIAVVLTG